MGILSSNFTAHSSDAAINTEAMQSLLNQVRAVEQRTRDLSDAARPQFEKRGQLLPRTRIGTLIDANAPFLELCSLAGYLRDQQDADRSIAGGGVIAGIAEICGVRVMLVASDSGIQAGAMGMPGLEKVLRAQEIALSKKLPFVHLVESAGANLLEYRVEHFIRGGGAFYNLARLSAAGIPVITVVHGASTAGGAYMPGLSDYVIMVRQRAYAYLAGPALLKAATGEDAEDEELGGADMHASMTGLADYVADDDLHALQIVRELVAALDWGGVASSERTKVFEPRYPSQDLMGIMPADPRQAVDMREVIARLVDDSKFLEFKADYGPGTVVGHASIYGIRIGVVTNNGPLEPDGANKVTHFVQSCGQSGIPLVFLHNTTGFLVGRAPEQGGMIKHGAKMIQAIANVAVPRIAIHCGASFGAGNYGMCGVGFQPDFAFSWPNARTAVMGGEQAAHTMALVMEATARRKGREPDSAAILAMQGRVRETFERQTGVLVTSGLLLDDGVIDPRDTRKVLGLVLDVCAAAQVRELRPVQYGVARP